MNIVSQETMSQPRIIAPKVMELNSNPGNLPQTIVHSMGGIMTAVNVANEVETFSVLSQDQNFDKIKRTSVVNESALITDNATTPSRAASPTNYIEINVSRNDDNILINALPESRKSEKQSSFAGIQFYFN